MKLPLDDSVGGGDGGHRDPAAEESNNRGGGEVQVQPNGQAAANGSAGPSEPDFSEYLWMEHEEEFDQEVLRELENEEEAHYWYDLYEASMAEEEAKRNSSSSNNNDSHHHPNSSSHHRQAPSSASHETPNCSIRIPGPTPPYNRASRNNYHQNDGLGDITRGLDRVSFSSRLNPNAAEFVPAGPREINK